LIKILIHRYLDIFLGLLLLLSMVSLLYGSYSQSSLFLITFLASSLAVVILYWCSYLYTKYEGGDKPVFQEEVRTADIQRSTCKIPASAKFPRFLPLLE
jgi:hypothetical protein